MSTSLLSDAFGHHAWATLRIIDACRALDAGQLDTAVPGTYGSILDTVRHLVGADRSYLFALTGGAIRRIDEDAMDLAELDAAMGEDGRAWTALLAEDLDPERIVVRRREDGSETHASVGIRLAQALHHGTDHRSQVCTALTSLGIEPPAIDVWDFAAAHDRLVEVAPTA
jgi:uncharacterized damage-inducible protein DinB